MITVIETSHRGQARTWTAADREDFVVKIVMSDWSGELDVYMSFQQAVDQLRSDLRYLEIIEEQV